MNRKTALLIVDSKGLNASQIIEHHNSVLGGRFVELKALEDLVF